MSAFQKIKDSTFLPTRNAAALGKARARAPPQREDNHVCDELDMGLRTAAHIPGSVYNAYKPTHLAHYDVDKRLES